MSIASGFTKMKNYILTSSGYKLLSRWTSSQTVHMGDGTDDTDTVEYRFGAIKGITTSTNVSETGYAADAKTVSKINQSLANQEKYIFISACSAVNTNVIKRFTLNGSDFEIYLAYTTETSATIAVTIDGIVVNLLGVCWRPGTSNQPSYVNTTNFTMQITSYFEAFTYTKLGYKISAILIGGAGQPTAVFSIESYKLI